MSALAIVSLLIRLLALGWSIVLLRRFRDWRIGFFSVIYALMVLRLIFSLIEAPASAPRRQRGHHPHPGPCPGVHARKDGERNRDMGASGGSGPDV